MKDQIVIKDSVTSFVGPNAVQLYRAQVIESALQFYITTGMKVNSGYTPSNMLRAAAEITGKKFHLSSHGYVAAIKALKAWQAEAVNGIPIVVERSGGE